MVPNAYLAIDEFAIVGTLSVAITSSGGVLGHTTVCIHLNKTDSTIEKARKVGHVVIECKLLILHVEHKIVGVIVHEVDTGDNVGVRTLHDEVEAEVITGGRDTIDTAVVRSIESTVLWISGTS